MTDDLDARQVAKSYHLDVHVTIGIILRSFREKIISKELGIEKVRELKSKSSLFMSEIENHILQYVVVSNLTFNF